MRWIAFILFVLAVPVLIGWLRGEPRRAPVVWGLLGFLPFVLTPWHLIVSPFSTPLWSGVVKGWDFSLLDSVALAIIFGTRGRWPRIRLLIPILLYVLAVAIAVTQAKFPNLALSYLVQMLRVVVVFLAVARISHLEAGQRAVMTGAILGLCVQACYAIVAIAGGALQTGGSLGHQNLLGFVSHFALIPAFAMLVAGRSTRIAVLGVVAGLIVVALTASRATIAFAGVGLILTLVLSIAIRFTSRKLVMGALGVVLMAAALPVANIALERRFAVQRTTFFAEDEERVAFAKAAEAMIAAKPMGVGPNHYVFVANTEGYSARAGVTWATASRSTNVHNSFLLVAAETGYLGVATFVLMILSGIGLAWRGAIRFRRSADSDLLVGLGCALVAASLHGLYEWMYLVFPSQYLMAMCLGLISGITARLSTAAGTNPEVRPKRARPRLASAAAT